MKTSTTRREFLTHLGLGATGLVAAAWLPRRPDAALPADDLFFKISLAEWSLAGTLFRGELDHLDFPAKAKQDFGIDAVEYVSTFWRDNATNASYHQDLKQRTDDLGVRNVLIMVDGEGNLADPDEAVRKESVENHRKWVDTAKFLGCHAIRVNLNGDWGEDATPEAVADAAVQGYGSLVEVGAAHELAIIVENHGGLSSNAQWLTGVMKQVNNPYAGTLPDFGNFCIKREGRECVDAYDRYRGTEELMPFAKGVSAKAHKFDAEGNETETDFARMLQIVKDAGYTGYVGIEFEGGFFGARGVEGYLNDVDGIRATKHLLERVGAELS